MFITHFHPVLLDSLAKPTSCKRLAGRTCFLMNMKTENLLHKTRNRRFWKTTLLKAKMPSDDHANRVGCEEVGSVSA